jgi:hypothetical protein
MDWSKWKFCASGVSNEVLVLFLLHATDVLNISDMPNIETPLIRHANVRLVSPKHPLVEKKAIGPGL